jgi:hypothetical protein
MSESGSERASASRINSATAYSNVDGDFSAMAAGSFMATIRQCPSNWAAIASGAEPMIAKANKAKSAYTIANHTSPS